MRFGPVPLDLALGAVLAHSQPLPDGTRLRKGITLGADDLQALAQAGFSQVTVARLDAQDLPEDAAALRVAQALAGPGLRVQAVGTGRVNLLAQGPGVVALNAAAIHAVNAADPMITLATLPEWQRVTADEMVATVKVIAYGVPETSVTRAARHAQGALALCPPLLQTAVLIETAAPGARPTKGRRVTEDRLARLNVTLSAHHVTPHDEAALAALLQTVTADLILILTASATSDPADTAPQALRRAGGVVHHVGMPVDPGNLLFLGSLGATPVIGLPGCAKSPALNGADWVLERIICGVPVGPAQIMAMGVGGLLVETPVRGRPRAAN